MLLCWVGTSSISITEYTQNGGMVVQEVVGLYVATSPHIFIKIWPKFPNRIKNHSQMRLILTRRASQGIPPSHLEFTFPDFSNVISKTYDDLATGMMRM